MKSLFLNILSLMFKQLGRGGLAKVWAFILQIVQELESSDLSNTDKRAKAFSDIRVGLKALGIELGDSIVNLLIEIAVQALKNEFLPGPPTVNPLALQPPSGPTIRTPTPGAH